jgi:hypothetical protein
MRMINNNHFKSITMVCKPVVITITIRTMWNSSRFINHMTRKTNVNATAYLRNTYHPRQTRSYAVERRFHYGPSATLNNNSRQDFPVLHQLVIGHINKLVFKCIKSDCI